MASLRQTDSLNAPSLPNARSAPCLSSLHHPGALLTQLLRLLYPFSFLPASSAFAHAPVWLSAPPSSLSAVLWDFSPSLYLGGGRGESLTRRIRCDFCTLRSAGEVFLFSCRTIFFAFRWLDMRAMTSTFLELSAIPILQGRFGPCIVPIKNDNSMRKNSV